MVTETCKKCIRSDQIHDISYINRILTLLQMNQLHGFYTGEICSSNMYPTDFFLPHCVASTDKCPLQWTYETAVQEERLIKLSLDFAFTTAAIFILYFAAFICPHPHCECDWHIYLTKSKFYGFAISYKNFTDSHLYEQESINFIRIKSVKASRFHFGIKVTTCLFTRGIIR